jgi:hypothetical protein
MMFWCLTLMSTHYWELICSMIEYINLRNVYELLSNHLLFFKLFISYYYWFLFLFFLFFKVKCPPFSIFRLIVDMLLDLKSLQHVPLWLVIPFTIQKVLCHLLISFELVRIGIVQPENQPTLTMTMHYMYLYLFRKAS